MTGRAAGKTLGQHFLTDARAAARIVEALRIAPDDPVLEIGPGRGALTGGLLRAAGRIAVVELDRVLAERLRVRYSERELLVLERDILRVELAEVAERLGAPGGRLLVAGNLPYNISKPVAQKMIRERERVSRAVLMFQREVADRLTAGPGSRRYGPLGLLAGRVYRIRALFELAPRAFSPPPKVMSTVTEWTPREDTSLSSADERRLRDCLAVCFARRRRTLRNNLRAALESAAKVDALLDAAGLDGGWRAEAVPPEGFVRLAEHWNER